MRVDLPTLGTPQASTRMGLAMPPRSGDSVWQASMMAWRWVVWLASSARARVPGWAL